MISSLVAYISYQTELRPLILIDTVCTFKTFKVFSTLKLTEKSTRDLSSVLTIHGAPGNQAGPVSEHHCHTDGSSAQQCSMRAADKPTQSARVDTTLGNIRACIDKLRDPGNECVIQPGSYHQKGAIANKHGTEGWLIIIRRRWPRLCHWTGWDCPSAVQEVGEVTGRGSQYVQGGNSSWYHTAFHSQGDDDEGPLAQFTVVWLNHLWHQSVLGQVRYGLNTQAQGRFGQAGRKWIAYNWCYCRVEHWQFLCVRQRSALSHEK